MSKKKYKGKLWARAFRSTRGSWTTSLFHIVKEKGVFENALCGVYCDTEYATVGATYRSFNHTYKADKCKKCLRLSNV